MPRKFFHDLRDVLEMRSSLINIVDLANEIGVSQADGDDFFPKLFEYVNRALDATLRKQMESTGKATEEGVYIRHQSAIYRVEGPDSLGLMGLSLLPLPAESGWLATPDASPAQA